ncbi:MULTISPECIES: methylamine utilization protein [Pseudoalteromonas]|uniref:Methylamine utilization protein n=1 Tax=Pseudoalteromonas obscura TaxID=3048491 RepID=A0ABT7ESY3_9GAMM|nr:MULTISPECIES: methylamine utilization protein [Pseudoalteromonas]MDK2598142.1 methylamine utilization protein [Pseudoalteromonas sp. P94(2023)]
MQFQQQVNKAITKRARWQYGVALSACLMSSMGVAKPLTLNVTGKDGKPVKEAVVWFESKQLTLKQNTLKQSYKMGQKDRAFTPHILVVPKGAEVSFPNYDSILHHVYSFSAAQPFEFKLYRDNPQSLTFGNTGVVELGCNIHDWMLGYILVVDSTYFAVTDEHGKAVIDMPEQLQSELVINVWHEGFANLDQPERKQLKSLPNTFTLTYQLNQSLFELKEDFSDEFDDYE